jgi:predicted HAD superfamily phosphohydrolase YqeG
MKTSYLRAATPAEVWACLTLLQAKTLVFDVEPLVAFWRTDHSTLADGITAVLVATAGAAPDSVVFATNSARRPPTPPAATWAKTDYLASARKPLRVAAYRDLPRPGVVIGDQTATDGILAWRLGYTFVHYTPQHTNMPLGPRLMHQVGRPIRPLLFRNP